eukprot:TRINITY_DN4798_c0_g1_i3.p1 TRINITY_DN4798_c0_g1~~TRINITY_DN4798_c0_g1_i3.p1  ORF type:complete len:132 (-),score=3.51 TRINITY_DN4798_c0_g1_i3:2-397(-)
MMGISTPFVVDEGRVLILLQQCQSACAERVWGAEDQQLLEEVANQLVLGLSQAHAVEKEKQQSLLFFQNQVASPVTVRKFRNSRLLVRACCDHPLFVFGCLQRMHFCVLFDSSFLDCSETTRLRRALLLAC